MNAATPRRTLADEFRPFMAVALPSVGSSVAAVLPGLIATSTVGQLCTVEQLDACVLGLMYTNLSGLTVIQGLASALDTLMAQAKGAQQHRASAQHLQCAALLIGVLLVPICALNWHASGVLRALGQPAALSREACEFCRVLLWSLPSTLGYTLLQKLCQAQQETAPLLWTALVTAATQVALTWCMVLRLGYTGAAWAQVLSSLLGLLLLSRHVVSRRIAPEVWDCTGWTVRTLANKCAQYTPLAIAGLLMCGLECWAFEFITLLAGRAPHGTTVLAANAVMYNMSSLCCQVYLGLGIATSVRVGLALGAADAHGATVTAKLSFCVALVHACLIGALIYTFQGLIPTLFLGDNNGQLIQMAANSLCVLAVYQVVDGLNGVCNGVSRGAGFQCRSAGLLFIAYYCIGLPLAACLAFDTHGLGSAVLTLLPQRFWHGSAELSLIWIGVVVGLFVASCGQLLAIILLDWTRLASSISQQAVDASIVDTAVELGESSKHHSYKELGKYGTFVSLESL